MYDNLQIRDSGEMVHTMMDTQRVGDHLENYGGNAGEKSRNQTASDKASTPPTPSRSKRGKQARGSSTPDERPPASILSATAEADGHIDDDIRNTVAVSQLSRKGRAGQSSGVTQKDDAGAEEHAVQSHHDNRSGLDSAPEDNTSGINTQETGEVDGGQVSTDTQNQHAAFDQRFADPLVGQIVSAHRMRRRWMKARNALILQGKAFSRALHGGDKDAGSEAFDRILAGKDRDGDEILMMALSPFIPAIQRFDEEMGKVEREMAKMAKKLPIAPYVESVKGLSFAAVAGIVGEAGDLSKYTGPAGIWKRLGLAVIDGDGRQRKVSDAEKALIHGYSPERRSLMWNVGNSLILGMGKFRPLFGEDVDINPEYTEFQRVFAKRARYEAQRLPKTKKIKGVTTVEVDETGAPICIGISDTGKESYSAHAAARAKRYTEKHLLKRLFQEWKRANGDEPSAA